MNEALLERVLQSPKLPSLPTIALEIIDLVQDPDVTVKQIADTIQYDPALSSKLLKTVNSSFYGQTTTVSSVSQAVVVLGLRSIKTLALGFSLVGNLKQDPEEGENPGFDHMAFWKRSLLTATAAKLLAQKVGVIQEEECFLGALMQDVGMIALYNVLGEQYEVILDTAGPIHASLRRHELEVLELDHAQVGGALAEAWKLPDLLVDPIRLHETPNDAPAPIRLMVRCIAAGNRAAAIYDDPENEQAVNEYYKNLQAWFNLDQETAAELLSELHKPAKVMGRLFELPSGDLGDPEQILARAAEVRDQILIQNEQEVQALEREKKELISEVNTDSLTGVANRRRFNAYLTEQFAASQREQWPISLMFLDADHFKGFNDQHGHATGDRVLVELGRILNDNIQTPGLACRYGGEEFSVILPKTTRRDAAILAEKIRQAIEEASIESENDEVLHITASIGVASTESAGFRRPEQLVKAADMGVYAAKHAGRNKVRVFTPKPAAEAGSSAA